MSYVIQNFYNPSKSCVITPKLKNLIILTNLIKLLAFFKINNLLYHSKWSLSSSNVFYIFFLKYFFVNGFKNLFFKLEKNAWSTYTNNLDKSFLWWKFNIILLFTRNFCVKFVLINFSMFFNFNSTFLTIKTNPTNFVKKYYKNFVFYNLFNIGFIWPQISILFKFYLNFLIIWNFYHLFKFYNGPFFKIYHF